MRLIISHLTRGLITAASCGCSRFPSTSFLPLLAVGQSIWHAAGFNPDGALFQSAAILVALLIMTTSLFAIDFQTSFIAGAAVIVFLILVWATATLS